MKSVIRLIFLTACLAALGCAPSSPPPATAKAAADVGDESTACERFATQMCERVDPRSRGCEAVQRVSRWIAPSACVVALRDIAQTDARLSALRGDCDEVGSRLCQKVEGNPEICEGLTADLKVVPAEDCASLLKAYPEVEAAFLERLAGEQPLAPELMARLLAGDPPAFGPAEAKVTLVLFSDFQCPYCSRVGATIERLKADYGDRIRLVFRQFPLSFHEHAHKAAQAAFAAHAQGKFWPMHDVLFAHQAALEADELEGYAKEAGLELRAFKQAMADSTYASAVDADLALGEQARVRGTPTLLINGVPAENPLDADAVAAQVDALLQASAAPSASAATPAPAATPTTAPAPAVAPAQAGAP